MHEHSVQVLLENREREKATTSDLTTTPESSERDNTRRNNFIIIETAVLISLLPPCVVSTFLIGYLAMNMELSTLRFHLDNNLIGVTGQNYRGWDCHFGIHPSSTNKDLHLSCSSGTAFNINNRNQSYYQLIIQNTP